MSNAEKIKEWRDAHQGQRITEPVLRDLIGSDLRSADLGYADLRDANLRDADLRYARLWGADLRDANLVGADLRGARMWDARLWGADLRCANLEGADLWGGLRVDGLPSGQATLIPTPVGWHLSVGCWSGTVDDLAALIAQDEGWPGARGEEVARRRPGLEALIVLCRAHMAMHEDVIANLEKRWGSDAEVTL